MKESLDLLTICTEFRKGILGDGSSSNYCFMVCYPLESYLSFLGFQVKLIQGEVRGYDHCWLRLGQDTIIDPTAEQFSTDEYIMPPVYIGPKPKHYKPHKST